MSRQGYPESSWPLQAPRHFPPFARRPDRQWRLLSLRQRTRVAISPRFTIDSEGRLVNWHGDETRRTVANLTEADGADPGAA